MNFCLLTLTTINIYTTPTSLDNFPVVTSTLTQPRSVDRNYSGPYLLNLQRASWSQELILREANSLDPFRRLTAPRYLRTFGVHRIDWLPTQTIYSYAGMNMGVNITVIQSLTFLRVPDSPTTSRRQLSRKTYPLRRPDLFSMSGVTVIRE